MGGDGFKKEIGPGLQTAAGAAMLMTGNPMGAMMLGSGIAGMAGGAMPDQKSPMAPPGGGAKPPGPGAGPGGPQMSAPTPTPISAPPGGMPGAGGPSPVAPPQDPRMAGGGGRPPIDPALKRFIYGQ